MVGQGSQALAKTEYGKAIPLSESHLQPMRICFLRNLKIVCSKRKIKLYLQCNENSFSGTELSITTHAIAMKFPQKR